MNKKVGIILIVVLVVGLLAAVYFLFLKKKNEVDQPGNNGNNAVEDPDDLATGEGTQLPGNINLNTGANTNTGTGNSNPTKSLWQQIVDDGKEIFSLGANNNTGNASSALLSATPVVGNILGQVFPLKKGSKSVYVKTIQTAANQSINKGQIRAKLLVVDGIWGSNTDAAVKQVYPSGVISFDLYNSIAAKVSIGKGLK